VISHLCVFSGFFAAISSSTPEMAPRRRWDFATSGINLSVAISHIGQAFDDAAADAKRQSTFIFSGQNDLFACVSPIGHDGSDGTDRRRIGLDIRLAAGEYDCERWVKRLRPK